MRILYLRQSNDTVDTVYINGLRENGVEVLDMFVRPNMSGFIDLIKKYRIEKNNLHFIIAGFSSPQLVLMARLISNRKIIFNSTVSVYDRLICSRELASHISIKALYYLMLDFLASHLSYLVMVESNKQGQFFINNFKISPKRVFRAWIGVDSDKYVYNPNVMKFPNFTVVFRGMFLPESGVEYAIRAAKILENKDVKFIIIGGGSGLGEAKKLTEELHPTNLQLITDFLPQEKLNALIQGSHLVLGQLANHPRLKRTIPYKAYESLAMNLPYLTASNSAILELLTSDKTCFICNPADAESLADKILWIKDNYKFAKEVAMNGHRLYEDSLTSGILAKKLLDKMIAL